MIKSKLTLKQLEAFVFVADLGSFRGAASALGTTQPNVSVRIAALEETLGTVLMHRDAGSIKITKQGEELLTASREVLRAAETLLDVAQRRDLIEERLRLGVTELVAATWLHDFLRAFKVMYPSVRVELTIDLSSRIEGELLAHRLDLAVLNGPVATRGFEALAMGSYRYGWVATPALAASMDPVPSIEDVFAQTVLAHGKETRASMELAQCAKDRGLQSEQIVHSSSLTASLNMAVDGMGVALLPRQLFHAQVAAGELVEVNCGWEPSVLEFSVLFDEKRSALYAVEAAQLVVATARNHRQ